MLILTRAPGPRVSGGDYKEKKLSLALLAVTGWGTADLSHLPSLGLLSDTIVHTHHTTPRHTTHHTTPRISILWTAHSSPALHQGKILK